MILEPENLIACLIAHIACSSLHGCSVSEVLGHAKRLLQESSRPKTFPTVPSEPSIFNDKELAKTVWQWLTSRSDVFVGRNGEWNHLSLDELMLLPISPTAPSSQNGIPHDARETESLHHAGDIDLKQPTASTNTQALRSLPSYQPKLFVSQDKAWESITGHGVDYQRIPKSQWEALLGIASAGEDGIIQGDLRRLIGQDKRSLPHRTELLAQRGYVVKRMTLIKGCKTSKLWLKRFAPNLPHNTLEPNQPGLQEEMSGEDLIASDSPVSWHERWTSGPIDMVALAKTIVAIIKAWGVMRFSDLKAKLGVKGRQWEMRVVARSCRFLAMRGCIKYVVASWEGRLFRDCVKFTRELNLDDWAAFLCKGMTPKRSRARLTRPVEPVGVNTTAEVAASTATDKPTTQVVWCPDEPLKLTIARLVRAAGKDGCATPQLVHMTLGSSFRRYISSSSSSLVTKTMQPPHLKYLEVTRELRRVGKAAEFRFFPASVLTAWPQKNEGKADRGEKKPVSNQKPSESASDRFGFGVPKTIPAFLSGQTMFEDMAVGIGSGDRCGSSGRRRGASTTHGQLRGSLHSHKLIRRAGGDGDEQGANLSGQEEVLTGRRVPRPNGVGRGRGRKVVGAASGGKHKCEKCGNSWKNDVGLKYHLSKSRTSCNPSYVDDNPPATRLPELERLKSPLSARSTTDASAIAEPSFSSARADGKEDLQRLVSIGGGIEGPMPAPDPEAGSISASRTRTPRSSETVGPYEPSLNPNILRTKKAGLGPGQVSENVIRLSPNESPPAHDEWRRAESGLGDQTRNQIQHRCLIDPVAHSNLTFASHPLAHIPSSIFKPNLNRLAQERTVPFQDNSIAPSPGKTPELVMSLHSGVVTSSKAPTSTLGTPLVAWTPKPFPMPAMESNRRQTVDQLISSRVSAMMVWLVDCLHGVFPGGKALGISAEMVWRHYFAGDPCPTQDRFAAELTKLVSKRKLCETSRWFRDPNSASRSSGVVNCRLVTSVDFDIDCDQLNKVVKAMKQVYPKPYLPEFLLANLPPAQEIQCANPVLTFTGRRIIVGKVEALHAPFYVSGSFSRKRPAARESLPGSKRLKLNVGFMGGTALQEHDEAASSEGHKATRQRRVPSYNAPTSETEPSPQNVAIWADDDSEMDGEASSIFGPSCPNGANRLVGDIGVDDSDDDHGVASANKYPPSTFKAHFLKPNTYLLKDYVASHGSAPFVDSDGEDVDDSNVCSGAHSGPYSPGGSGIGTVDQPFVFSTILKPAHAGTEGLPCFGRKWFESRDCSFTVKTWAPDRAWLELESFPTRVQGLLARRTTLRGGLYDIATEEETAYRQFMDRLIAIHHVELKPCYSALQMPTCGWPWRVFVHLENCTVYPLVQQTPQLQWKKSNQLTIDSAPRIYCQRTDSGVYSAEESDWVPESIGRRRRRAEPTLRGARRGGRRQDGVLIQAKHWRARPLGRHSLKRRYLTQLPETESATMPCSASPFTRISVATPELPSTQPSSLIPAKSHIIVRPKTETQEDILLAAFVVVRTLLGGTGEAIDWGLMMHLFPGESLDGLRRCWARCRKFRSGFMSKLTAKFQKSFIGAYERDEIPAISYDNTHAYDWMGLIRWALAIRVEEDVQLPASRVSFIATHSFHDDPNGQPLDDWKDKYFHPQSSVFSRLEAVTSEAVTLPLYKCKPPDLDLRLTRSLIKAFSGTPAGRYTDAEIRTKFAPYRADGGSGASLLKRAVMDLTSQKAISKTEKSTHPYRLSEQFHTTLSKFGQAKKYRDAAQFKSELDTAVARQVRLRLSYNLRDGATMACINLQARHRISIQPVGVPEIPLGFEPGRYETRKFNKKYYRFGLEIFPTTDYLVTDAIAVVQAAQHEKPPTLGPWGEIPVWCDLFGQLDRNRWAQLVGAMLFVMATRGSLSTSIICQALKPLVEEFEVELIIQWAERVGVISSNHDGACWAVTEWWWLVVNSIYENDFLA